MSCELICSKIYIEMEIQKFSEHKTNEYMTYIESPTFDFLKSKWRLRVRFFNRDQIYMYDLTLIRENMEDNITISFTLGIKDSEPAIKHEGKRISFGAHKSQWTHKGYNYFDDLPKVLNKYAQEDAVAVYLEAYTDERFGSTGKDVGSQCSSLYSTVALSDTFQDLLLSEKDSDVTIEVQGEIFKVHKIILKSRSPVFAAMFEHNMLEKNGGIVKIDDCDPDIFCIFLQCIYTGTVDYLLPGDAISLYRVADKYELTDLKEKCSIIMEEGMAADNVCDVIILSDMHNDINLKKSSEEFLITNMETVLSTSEWAQFIEENSALAAKILEKAFKKTVSP